MPTNLARKRSIEPMPAVPPANDGFDRAADARLIESARAGDVAAFEQVYRREVGRVYALCLRMTADAQRARELTQTVFVRAWDRLGSFRGDSQLSSWLHRIAVNEVLIDARTERRRRARVVLAEDEGAASEESDEPDRRDAPRSAGITLPVDTESRIDLE
jgi:RNA polymerase sigma-70 factor, ECF subfamily